MQLSEMTWPEVGKWIEHGACVMLPVGSTEQHGPMGRIGTDTICAEAVAQQAADLCDAIVAPSLAYTPAPFNTSFPGTVSVSEEVFAAHAGEVIRGLLAQGFKGVFVVNGHGANIAPLKRVGESLDPGALTLLSWWEPAEVNALRQSLYGAWEGMHATPSEVAITQTLMGELPAGDAENPPEALSTEYINAHKGDKHGPPDEHRAMFPDGRVGSHSALATPEDGARLLELAAQGISDAFVSYAESRLGLTQDR
jgi:creatinine amidohydrolase